MSKLFQPLLLGGLAAMMFGATSCAGGTVAVRGEVGAPVEPTLAYIGDGVWVVAEYDHPVFYSDGYYWRYNNGYWYQSHRHYGDWRPVRRSYVPRHLGRIDRPRRYIDYRVRGDMRVRRGPPPGEIRVRDNRTYRSDRRYDRRNDRRYDRRYDRDYDRRDRRDYERRRRHIDHDD